MRGSLRLVLMAAALSGCGDDDEIASGASCPSYECFGQRLDIELVDDVGAPVAAHGEYRRNDSLGGPFDCTGEIPDERCDAGVLTLDSVRGDTRIEIHFRLPDGTWTEWQPVALSSSGYSAPGIDPSCFVTCAVKWSAMPVLVPVAARIPPE